MRLSPRRILRIALSLVIIAVVWSRAAGNWRDLSGMWLAGSIILSLLLLVVVFVEVTGIEQKWRKQREQVPKKPLGLDS
jgi:membrane protein YdbS with pleckstrin-like domain